ncbi:MAG TPA: hypothetical protein VFU37_16245 [Pyrinomonadaceae bacterium]|nr:hypothetical protein [Pyrinomonadaceae bacterium]
MFKLISRLAVLALMLTSSVSASQRSEWIKVAPIGSGFSVMMPAKPEEQIQSGDELTTHSFGVTTDNGLYIVAYGDFAPSIRLNADEELIATRDRFMKRLDAKLISTKNISFEDRQGIEFTGENYQASFKSRVFIFGNRVHQIAVAVFNGKNDTENADRFFASFEFIKAKTQLKP